MRLTEMWKTSEKPTISFELFPARNEKGAGKLVKVIDKLAATQPNFVSVTFGAGGFTREGSYQLVKKLKEEKGLEVLPYFTCIGLGPDDIASIANAYQELGVESLLAVRGDPPRNKEGYEPHPESFAHASDFISFLKQRTDLCLGAAGHPEGHIEALNKEKDIEFLKLKVECGAEFIIANYFWDNQYFFNFMESVRSAGIQVPVLPGVMPIFSEKLMRNLAALCGATITEEIESNLAALPDEKGALLNFGVELATRQCRELLKSGVPGIHIYTMDKSKSAVRIVKALREEGLV
ncbi:MAG: 5,10-methylenetetrahydrofolate reductase [Proteobacteria bacterium]|nr:5,10-methylenetetrahydrofolate reductase [Pseudomonadota bacterium]